MPSDRRMTFDSAHDVNLRLNGCLSLFKRKPVLLSYEFRTREGTDVSIDGFDTKGRGWLKDLNVNDPEFDVRSPELGYFNSKAGSALYVMRMPARRQQQGLNSGNTLYYDAARIRNGPYNNVTKDMLGSQGFAEMVLNEYPDLEKAIKNVIDKTVQSSAFHKDLSIGVDEIGLYKVHFKTKPIGVYNNKKSKFYVSERFEYFVPKLKEYGIDADIT